MPPDTPYSFMLTHVTYTSHILVTPLLKFLATGLNSIASNYDQDPSTDLENDEFKHKYCQGND